MEVKKTLSEKSTENDFDFLTAPWTKIMIADHSHRIFIEVYSASRNQQDNGDGAEKSAQTLVSFL